MRSKRVKPTAPSARPKKNKAPPKSKKTKVLIGAPVTNNNTIVQQARGKVVRQSATIVNVRMQAPNPPGMVRPMNPNVHTIAIPSQVPAAFPSAAVNRAATISTSVSAATMTDEPSTSRMPSLSTNPLFDDVLAQPLPPFGGERAQPLPPFGGDTAMGGTPMSSRIPKPLAASMEVPAGPPQNLEQHQLAFDDYNARYKAPNESAESKRNLSNIAEAVKKDTKNLEFIKAVNAPHVGKYYSNLHAAMKKTLSLS